MTSVNAKYIKSYSEEACVARRVNKRVLIFSFTLIYYYHYFLLFYLRHPLAYSEHIMNESVMMHKTLMR